MSEFGDCSDPGDGRGLARIADDTVPHDGRAAGRAQMPIRPDAQALSPHLSRPSFISYH